MSDKALELGFAGADAISVASYTIRRHRVSNSSIRCLLRQCTTALPETPVYSGASAGTSTAALAAVNI